MASWRSLIRRGISRRILGIPLICFGVAGATVQLGYLQTARTSAELSKVVAGELERAETLLSIFDRLALNHSSIFDTLALLEADEEEIYERSQAQLDEVREDVRRWKQYRDRYTTHSNGSIHADVTGALSDYLARVQGALAIAGVNRPRAARLMYAANQDYKRVNAAYAALVVASAASARRAMQGAEASLFDTHLTLVVLLAAGLVVGCVASVLIARPIVRPVLALARAAERMRAGDLEVAIDVGSADELGTLAAGMVHMRDAVRDTIRTLETRQADLAGANEQLAAQAVLLQKQQEELATFNRELEERVHARTEELRAAQRQLVDASRRAGMAEIATGVLHNVGNALNSITTSASWLRTAFEQTPARDLARAAELIDDHAGDLAHYITSDPRGRHFPAFFVASARSLAALHDKVLAELQRLGTHIVHVTQIVRSQQTHARGAAVLERAAPAELMRDALRLCQGRWQGIERVEELPDLPELLVDRHAVIQVLVNLVRNAREALDPARPGRIIVRVCQGGEGDAAATRFEVEDNGIGIAAERLGQIFGFGFTTKPDGHGFGLHGSALVARTIGARLDVRSEGPGRGATFVFELPGTLVAPPESGRRSATP